MIVKYRLPMIPTYRLVKITKFIFENQEKYQQVFSEKQSFSPDLSILDVLFNLGPETTRYLERQSI